MEPTTSGSPTTATVNIKTQNKHACGNCTKSHEPVRASFPVKDSTCWSHGKTGHWDTRYQSNPSRQKDPNKKPPRHGPMGAKTKADPQCWCRQGVWSPMWWSPCQHHCNQHQCITEAWATLTMPAEIGPNHCEILWCKVHTGASGNVMPLHIFAKLWPRHITRDGKPNGLHPCDTTLTAYTGSNIPPFGALDTTIKWTPKGNSAQSVSRPDGM